MLSNLSDLLMSRVDPDPVQAQTSMVAMSPQSQAQAMQQQVAAAPAQAKYLQAGKPVKQFNAMTANMTAANPTGAVAEDKYKALLKGDYTALNPKDYGGSVNAFLEESEEMKFKRSRMRPSISDEELNKMLYTREQAVIKRDELKAKGLPMAQVEKQTKEYLKSLGLNY
jgi:ribosomal protein L18